MAQNETIAHNGFRRYAAAITARADHTSPRALLAASGLAPLYVSSESIEPIAAWLDSLGASRLANWLVQWSQGAAAKAIEQTSDTERILAEQIARDLQTQIADDSHLAADIGIFLERIQAIPAALDALAGQTEKQLRLLRMMLEEAQSATLHNEQTSGDRIQGDKVTGDKVMGDKVGGNKISTGAISISGSVGTVQSINVTGGVVQGSIIGSQPNSTPPTVRKADTHEEPRSSD
jgi:hypothetical protein